MQAEILVVLVTYNDLPWAKTCFDRLFSSTIIPDVFVWDNGSTDGSQKYILQHYPNIILQQSSENLGFGRANNEGVKYAIRNGYKFVYLLNQDAWVDDNVFEELIKVKKQHPEYGILSPLQLTGDGTLLDKNFLFNVKEKRCPGLLRDLKAHQEKDVYTTEFVMAAHWFLAVEDLKKVGLFSPVFRHYGEDENLVARYKYWGYKIGVCPKVRAYHDRQYRVVEPEKQLYLWYTSYLAATNDPLHRNLFKPTIKFAVNLFFFTKVKLSVRFEWFIKGIKEIKIGKKYIKEYKKEGYMLKS